MEKKLLEIGKIVNTHGLRGEVKIVPWTDAPDVFEDLTVIYIKNKSEYKPLNIESVRYQKNNLIVKFKEYSDINDILQYKNAVLYAERDDLGELPEGVYYIVDLIGLEVFTESGEKIGIIADVFNTGASDIYDVKRDGKKNLLLPVIDEVVKNVDIEGGKVIVNVMEGLDDEV
ncbi:MAG: ribosome maturation factor RimM [Clostridia bacterium]|nr:ribosome maturation factor RimM [Clostridia bacterium]